MMAQPDDALLADMEACAVTLSREAGAVLARHFGTSLEVEYKDKGKRDPVTVADKESQDLIVRGIRDSFPSHGILAEEDETGDGDDAGEMDEMDETPAPDLVWAVDPLDGTRNFICGLPVYACSIGAMYRGVPVVGAIFVPWPGRDGGGVVLHARKGGGASVEGETVSVFEAKEPKGSWLASLPGSFGGTYRFDGTMRGKVGDVRAVGSIAYEVALVARGVFQYCLIGGPSLWDVVAGAALAAEANGIVMQQRSGSGFLGITPPRTRWDVVESLVPSWRSGATTMEDLRKWSTPLVIGGPGVASYVASKLRIRRSLRGAVRSIFRKPSA